MLHSRIVRKMESIGEYVPVPLVFLPISPIADEYVGIGSSKSFGSS
jgi:hypothetical protein